MTTVPKAWTFAKLPPEAVSKLLELRVLAPPGRKREAKRKQEAFLAAGGLGLGFGEAPAPEGSSEVFTLTSLIWATDDYQEGKARSFSSAITEDDLKLIKPRVEKSQAEQKRRVKAKAEVFTPSWVCNLQNNLVDEALLGAHLFNTVSEDQRTWTPTLSPVEFPESYPWTSYLTDRRLELCCGEGPYLMSPYDTTTGEYLPVLDQEGRFQRIGILDRKLRVAHEHADDLEQWRTLALHALKSTYGYEWQGDNLLLARLNFLNTYFDYLQIFIASKHLPKLSKSELEALAVEVAGVAAQQLWQMDGLKMVTPLSCEVSKKKCLACEKKARTGHVGQEPVLTWGFEVKSFASLVTT